MSKKVLLISVHPSFHQSIANRALSQAAEELEFVRVHSLYESYPDFQIDRKHEQDLLLEHDVIAFLHPFYWYSTPALMKEWLDVVLEYGFAYGPGGTRLQSKIWKQFITTGGSDQAYQPEGSNRFRMEELLKPFDQTAHLCKMQYLKPWILHSANDLSPIQIAKARESFVRELRGFQ